jgi:hypothetical protein
MRATLFVSVLALTCAASLSMSACVGDDRASSIADAAADSATAPSDSGEAGVQDTGAVDARIVPGTGRIDRMGRPAINTALDSKPLKDAYNREDTFASSFPTTYDVAFEQHLEAFDRLALDGTNPDAVDFPISGGVHPLREALKLDTLVVDTSKACSAGASFSNSYLEIEAELLLGGPLHVTCGGRTPNEDVMDKTMTLLVTKGRAPVGDGVSAATKPATLAFPYLAEPN